MMEMKGKDKMGAAKMHYQALMEALAALGLSLAEFEDQMEGEGSEEEGGEYEEPMGEDGEEDEEKKPIDKAKVAVIVARMKNKMKG
jgi:hypothetical protein